MVLQQRHGKTEISAGGIVFKVDLSGIPKWLIVQHSKHKGWIFPKGLVGDKIDGEEKEETAIREVEEEGGVKARICWKKPFTGSYIYFFQGQKIFKTVYFYLMEYLSGDINNHDNEVSDAKWLATEETEKLLSYTVDREIFRKAVDIQSRGLCSLMDRALGSEPKG